MSTQPQLSALSNSDPSPVISDIEQQVTALAKQLQQARDELGRVIFGQDVVVDLCLTTILSGGHFLLMSVPGLGKTKLVTALGTVLGLESKRIQCTPDLMPSDILGTEILRGSSDNREFKFIKGPVFSQLLMADEINRASPRTQSALLQAMQEYHVSVSGVSHDLPRPFHVMATQNPLEQDGTYPLPEAQLDRFMLQIEMGYTASSDERRMMLITTSSDEPAAQPVFNTDSIQAAQRLVRHLPIGDSVVDGILSLVQAGRPEQTTIASVKKYVSWGPGPRAAQAFMLASRARALMDGRFAPSLDDVIALAPSILKHRMDLRFAARADNVTLDQIVHDMCSVIR